MSVVLVGYRGCGRPSVGRLLADRLGCELVDTDALIVARARVTIKEILARFGESHSRMLKFAALDVALHSACPEGSLRPGVSRLPILHSGVVPAMNPRSIRNLPGT